MTAIGERLESKRGNATQREFAASLGIPLTSYTNWLTGPSSPKMEHIIRICTNLGVSADWLLGLPERSGGITQQATANGPGGQAVALAHGNVVLSPGRVEALDCSTCKYKRLAEVIKAAI